MTTQDINQSNAPSERELVIEGGRPKIWSELKEFWSYRSLILAFAERDVRVKYKQVALGAFWAIFQPLVFVAIISFAASRFTSGATANYPAFALSAWVPWIFLQTAVTFGSNAVIVDAALVRKIYFPKEVPVIGAVGAAGVDLGIGLVMFAIVGPFLGAHVSLTWLIAPFLAVILATLAIGVALTLSALNVYYRDFRYIIPLSLQLWLFASPVIYSVDKIPASISPVVYSAINPAAGILDSFRRVLALGQLPDVRLLGASTLSTIFVLFVGYRVFKGLERNFADIV